MHSEAIPKDWLTGCQIAKNFLAFNRKSWLMNTMLMTVFGQEAELPYNLGYNAHSCIMRR